MQELYKSSRHHKIIVRMIFSALIDEYDLGQGDIHKTENAHININVYYKQNDLCIKIAFDFVVDSIDKRFVAILTHRHHRFVQPLMFRFSNQ